MELCVMQLWGISVNASCKEEREHNKPPMDAWHWKYIGKYEFWGDGNASAGIRPWCLKGTFSGATTTGYPTRRALYSIPSFPNLDIGALCWSSLAIKISAQSFCEKSSVKRFCQKQFVFQEIFQEVSRGRCPLVLPKIQLSLPQLPSGPG